METKKDLEKELEELNSSLHCMCGFRESCDECSYDGSVHRQRRKLEEKIRELKEK